MNAYRWMIGFLVVGVLLAPASRTVAAPAQSAPVVKHQRQTTAQSQSAAQSYAAREVASAPKVEKFHGGGSDIYIGGSTVVIILLVVLIIVII